VKRYLWAVTAMCGTLIARSAASLDAIAVDAHAAVASAADAGQRESAARPLARLALDTLMDAPASLSADGRYVAFETRAGLVPGDVNKNVDVYVLDRTTGRLTLESVAFDGRSANGTSNAPRLSGDGRWLVFQSGATNLVRESLGQRQDVYLRDRVAGTTRGLAPGLPLDDVLHASGGPVISKDGRVVAFWSHATQLVDGVDANGTGGDVYVLTLDTGTIVRASVTSRGVQQAAGVSFAPSITADGTIVTFTSTADLENQNGGAAFERSQIFVRDLARGTTRLVSAAPNGRGGNQISHGSAISADGRFVAFVSMASNLGPADDNRLSDVYVRDLQTGTIALVSRTRRGKAGNGASSRPAISADGQFVAFVSEASDLECGRRCAPIEVDDNLLTDVYLADLRGGTIQRVSGAADHAWWTASQSPAMDAHATTVAFPAREPIDPRDLDGDFDLFIWIRSSLPAGS
jgi:Tol biopolymer transport system component